MTDERNLHAWRWSAIGTAARLFAQFAGQVLLARLVGPDEYGLFALAMMVIGFASIVAEGGLAYGFIQNRSPGSDAIRFALTWQAIIGIVMVAGIATVSGATANYLGQPRLRSVLLWLSIVCLTVALAAPSKYLLAGSLDQRQLQRAQFLAYVAGYLIVGIPLAFVYRTVWALVASAIVSGVIGLVLMYLSCRHPVRPLVWYPGAEFQVRSAVTVAGTGLLNWGMFNVDRLAVGAWYSPREVGLYASAYNLLQVPVAAMGSATQPVLHAGLSAHAHDKQRLADLLVVTIGLTLLVAVPLFILIAAFAHDIVGGLYGAPWSKAGDLMRILSFAMPFLLLLFWTTPTLWVRQRGWLEFATQLPLLLAWVVGLMSFGGFGLGLVAGSVVGVFAFRAIFVIWAALRLTGLSSGGLVKALHKSAAYAVIGAIAVALVASTLDTLSASVMIRLACMVALGIAFLVIPTRLPSRWLDPRLVEWRQSIVHGWNGRRSSADEAKGSPHPKATNA